MIMTFRHPLFGSLTAEINGREILLPAIKCARKLWFVMPRRALIQSGTVIRRGNINKRIDGGIMVDYRDLWKLIRYGDKCWWRRWLSGRFYDWVYDVICPKIQAVSGRGSFDN